MIMLKSAFVILDYLNVLYVFIVFISIDKTLMISRLGNVMIIRRYLSYYIDSDVVF